MKSILRPVFLLAALLASSLLASCSPGEGQGGSGTIIVQSKPDAASVTCDGKSHGVTPAKITGLIAGSHIVRVGKVGHTEEVRAVSLLDGGTESVEFSLEPETGLLLVHSRPEGAEIVIADAARGRTPALLTNLPLGEHRIRLTAQGHEPREIIVNLDSRVPKRILEDLASTSGAISIVSTPPGAEVFIDGRNSGTTPVTVEAIPKGPVRIQLRLAGYHNYEQPLTVLVGQTQEVTARLDPIPGTLRVVSMPEGARVYVDDAYKGDAPLLLKDLAPGSYRVRAEVAGFAPMARTATVRNGGETTEEFRLATNSGVVNLITVPAGAEVFLNGKSYGKTSFKGSDAASDPLKVEMLPAGDYTLTLTLKGYGYSPRRIQVQANQTLSLTETLSRQYIPDTIVRVGLGTDQAIVGALIRRHPNGDIELQTGPSSFRTITKDQIVSVEPLLRETNKP